MIFEKIPLHLATNSDLHRYYIHPPNENKLSLSKLLSPNLDSIEGESQPLGYSTTASILEHAYHTTHDEARFVLKIDINENQGKHEKLLVDAIATKLLMEILYKDIVPTSIRKDAAQLIANHVPNHKKIISSGKKGGFDAAIVKLMPHMLHLPNVSSSLTIQESKTADAILDCNKKGKFSLQTGIEIAREAMKEKYSNKYPVAIIDASGKSSNKFLNEVIGNVVEVGIMPKLVGPSILTADRMTGQSTKLRWDEQALIDLSRRALDVSSRYKLSSLRPIMDIGTKGNDLSPEEMFVAAMNESGTMHPGVLIRAINQFLPWQEGDKKHNKSKVDTIIQSIRDHNI